MPIASGQAIGAYSLTEPMSGSDAGSMSSRAVRSADGSYYTINGRKSWVTSGPVSYTHLRAHETVLDLVCRLLLEKKNNTGDQQQKLAVASH